MLPNLFPPIHCGPFIDVNRSQKVDISIVVSFARKHGPPILVTIRPGELNPERVCRWWFDYGIECTRR